MNEAKLSEIFNYAEWEQVVDAAREASMPVDSLVRMLVLYGIEKRGIA